MQNIRSIYIIDTNGDPFFVKELYIQGEEGGENGLLFNFLSAIQILANELGGEEAKTVKMGDIKLYSLKDRTTGLTFVIKASLEAKDKKFLKILTSIKRMFMDLFLDKFSTTIDEKYKILHEFSTSLDILLKQKLKIPPVDAL